MSTTTAEAVLDVKGLVKEFQVGQGGRTATLTAVGGVDLVVRAGETLALVGESGSGKSTVARCITRLIEPTSGTVDLDGTDLTTMSRKSLWKAYSNIQMVFQDPNSSLNPRMTAGAIIEEPLRLHTTLSREARRVRAEQLLGEVSLGPEMMGRYPRQLSGGQRQRVGIARALAVEPKFLLLDEPTASLDVSVRGQVLQLLQRVQQQHQLGYLLISHDLEVVSRIADRVAVMYLGRIVEQGTAQEVFENPTHPYTRALLSAVMPTEHGHRTERFRLAGEIPSPINLPTGCRLASRCPLVQPSCVATYPDTIPLSATHSAACPIVISARPPTTGSALQS